MSKIFRVLGPPGTGKTTYLTRELNKILETRGADSVIVSSFTKTAAEELAGRNKRLKKQIGTLHHHAYHSLPASEVAAGEHLKDFNENFPQHKLSGAQSLDDGMSDIITSKTKADDLMSRMNIYRAQMVEQDLWAPSVRSFHKHWTEWKQSSGMIDFTDMIEMALAQTDTAPGNPEIFFYDEAQDSTPLEMALVRKWAAATEYTIMAGDDDQLLYTFLGATPDTLVNGHFDHTQVLSQSYRVPRAVQKVAELWISKVKNRVEKDYKPRDFEGEVIRSRVTLKNTSMLANKVERDLDAGKSVMILTTCSYMLNPVLGEFRRRGIAFGNRYRKTEGAWNPIRKKGTAGAVSNFLLPCKDVYGAEARLWTPKELGPVVRILKSKGVLARGVKDHYEERFMERDMTSEITIEKLMELFPMESSSIWEVLNQPNKAEMLAWLKENLVAGKAKTAKYPMKLVDRYGTIPDDPKLTVGTIHSVKGAQADVVYLFPDMSARGAQSYYKKGDDRDSIIRAFYVGMTRAKEKLVLCHGDRYAVRW